MRERYQIWHPWQAQTVDISRVTWDCGQLSVDVILRPDQQTCRVVFRSPIATRFTDEGNRFATTRDASWPNGIGILVVEHSSFLAWLRNENGGIYDADAIRHFAIYSEDSLWVDVISILEPEISLLPK
jgi:hypothetical protein